MKSRFKRKKASGLQQSETDVTALFNTIQQQLVYLEQKLDVIMKEVLKKPFEVKRSSKPFPHFDRSRRHGKGRRDNGPRERNMTKSICADCNTECEVPFKPSGDRPVYCKECFSKRKENGSFKEKQGRFWENRTPRERYFEEQQKRKKRRQHGI